MSNLAFCVGRLECRAGGAGRRRCRRTLAGNRRRRGRPPACRRSAAAAAAAAEIVATAMRAKTSNRPAAHLCRHFCYCKRRLASLAPPIAVFVAAATATRTRFIHGKNQNQNQKMKKMEENVLWRFGVADGRRLGWRSTQSKQVCEEERRGGLGYTVCGPLRWAWGGRPVRRRRREAPRRRPAWRTASMAATRAATARSSCCGSTPRHGRTGTSSPSRTEATAASSTSSSPATTSSITTDFREKVETRDQIQILKIGTTSQKGRKSERGTKLLASSPWAPSRPSHGRVGGRRGATSQSTAGKALRSRNPRRRSPSPLSPPPTQPGSPDRSRRRGTR